MPLSVAVPVCLSRSLSFFSLMFVVAFFPVVVVVVFLSPFSRVIFCLFYTTHPSLAYLAMHAVCLPPTNIDPH